MNKHLRDLKDKIQILHRNGFLRDQDRTDIPRILARWRIYEATPQKSARTVKPTRKEAA